MKTSTARKDVISHDPSALPLEGESLDALARLFASEILSAICQTSSWPGGAAKHVGPASHLMQRHGQ